MLIIHHLGRSQSERIIWLCEELGFPYALKTYERDPVTIFSPPALRALFPTGAAPVIEDDGVLLAESGAIVDYILQRYGQGRLVYGPGHPNYVPFLYWFHYANGTFQPVMGRNMILRRLDLPADNPVLRSTAERLDRALGMIEERLAESAYFAGPELTAADIMMVFSLTTMRLFLPLDLSRYPGILAYLQRIGARPAYRRAMQKGDPDLTPLLS